MIKIPAFARLPLLLAFFVSTTFVQAQTIPAYRTTDWSKAGMQDTVPTYATTVNIMNYGGVADGVTPNDAAYTAAVAALNNASGYVYFPAGSYKFNQTKNLRDSLVLKGDGSNSKLLFDLGGNITNMINIQGTIDATVWDVTQPIVKGTSQLVVSNATGLNVGDWVQLYGDDVALLFSNWAYGSVGQIFHITNIQGNTLTMDGIARRSYALSFTPKLKRMVPVKGAGLQCLYIERVDATANQTTNVNFTNAVNGWMIGVESYKTNFAHVELTRASHITIRGNYIHQSHAYGGNGQGYGTVVQYTSGDCLIANNVFDHLRHSMLVQAGSNGNVFSYNYSHDPYWDEALLPANSAGDAVCHGNYTYMNLFEGNILQNVVIDDSHGINGPFNTYFRNRIQLWGITMNTNPASDSITLVGNEITNTNFPYGGYTLAGNGRFEHGNNKQGTITPTGTNALPEQSLYLLNNMPPKFWSAVLPYPHIGTPYAYNTGNNPAKLRYDNNTFTDCTLNPNYTPPATGMKEQLSDKAIALYPNPLKGVVTVKTTLNIEGNTYSIYDVTGRLVMQGSVSHSHTLDLSALKQGLYLFVLNTGANETFRQQLIKE